MDFENIKKLMDADDMGNQKIPTSVQEIKESEMPIQKVRRTMKIEIIIQLVSIIVFFAAPSFVEMYALPKAMYYVLMFITTLIILGYSAKMTWFLKKTGNITMQSKEVVMNFIFDLKLTLEVYKTAIIAVSLLVQVPISALLLGTKVDEKDMFSNLLLLDASTQTLLMYGLGYAILAVFIYFLTELWAHKLYGVHVKKLEEVLEQFNT